MQVLKTIKFLMLLGVICSGCYYDSEEDLYESIDCQAMDMSYAADIVPIIQADCYVCHAVGVNNGNVTLEGYSNISKYANDGRLLGVIKHQGGFSPMPKGKAKLLDCEIAKIESWITSGALNN